MVITFSCPALIWPHDVPQIITGLIPVRYSSDGWSEGAPEPCDPREGAQERTPPYRQARLWRQEMENDARLTRSKIAAREGVSRARVTQIMNLLALPEEIQEFLLNPPAPLQMSDFSERSLRQIVAVGDPGFQLRQWRERVAACQNLVRK